MGWFTRTNVTAAWPPQDFKLHVDLNELTLNSIACGQLAECLNFLGPGEHGQSWNEYRFPDKGVTLCIERELLTAFHVHPHPTAEERDAGMQPFTGVVYYDGKPQHLGATAGVANFVASLPTPDYFEETEDQRILTFHTFRREWELLLDRDGRANMISVYAAKQ